MLAQTRFIAISIAVLFTAGAFAVGATLGASPSGLALAAVLVAGAGGTVGWAVRHQRRLRFRALVDALANRYFANFVQPVQRALASDTSFGTQERTPRAIWIFLLDDPSAHGTVRRRIAQTCTRAEIERAGGERRYGVYLYAAPDGPVVVDLPSTLRKLPSSANGDAEEARRTTARFRRRLQTLLNKHATPGAPVRLLSDPDAFPMAE